MRRLWWFGTGDGRGLGARSVQFLRLLVFVFILGAIAVRPSYNVPRQRSQSGGYDQLATAIHCEERSGQSRAGPDGQNCHVAFGSSQ